MSQVVQADLRGSAYLHPRPQLVERREVLQSVAGELGVDAEAVRSALRGGSSLADVAKAHGVSRERLVDAIEDGLGQAARQTGRSVGGAQPAELAERLADRVARPVARPTPALFVAGLPSVRPPTVDLLA